MRRFFGDRSGNMRRLIINADDFGLTGSVNRGIVACHQAGVVTSTTLMVNTAAAAEAAALAGENPSLGVGLHLNLASGEPALPPEAVPSLVDGNGRFPGLAGAVLRLTAGRVNIQELEAEIGAQIEKCTRLGVAPTHIDSHRHLHIHPRLMAAIGRVCPGKGITRIRGYRMKPRSPRALAVAAAARLAGLPPGMKAPDRFFGVEVMGKKDMALALAKALAADGDVLEFMCHPGYADAELAGVSGYNRLREVELQALLSGGMRAVIRAAGVEMVSYGDL